jgi:hypothetical protein
MANLVFSRRDAVARLQQIETMHLKWGHNVAISLRERVGTKLQGKPVQSYLP